MVAVVGVEWQGPAASKRVRPAAVCNGCCKCACVLGRQAAPAPVQQTASHGAGAHRPVMLQADTAQAPGCSATLALLHAASSDRGASRDGST